MEAKDVLYAEIEQMANTEGWKTVLDYINKQIKSCNMKLLSTPATMENLDKLRTYQNTIQALAGLTNFVDSILKKK